MTPKQYFIQCQNLDWYYQYSDDHSVWQRGMEIANAVQAIAMMSPIFKKIYDDYSNYIFKKGPKPNIEDYGDYDIAL